MGEETPEEIEQRVQDTVNMLRDIANNLESDEDSAALKLTARDIHHLSGIFLVYSMPNTGMSIKDAAYVVHVLLRTRMALDDVAGQYLRAIEEAESDNTSGIIVFSFDFDEESEEGIYADL